MKHLLAAAFCVALGTAGQAWAQGTALVIGNGSYQHAPTAETAVRDARAVAEALETGGWTVIRGANLDRAAMRETIAEFAAAQEGSEATVIFYSGHALRTGGATFMAPTDTEADNLPHVLFDAVPFDLLLSLAARTPGKSVVFIDGAQLRGFTPRDFVEPGITEIEAPEGVLLVSAAAPGRAVRRSAWRDSRFARVIVDRFLSPGESAMERATRAERPIWTTGSADPDFALVAAPEETGGSELEREIELAYWRTAERTGRTEDYRAYLERYPNGTFAEFARQRLGITGGGSGSQQEPEVDPAVVAETALNLSRIRKKQVQEWLQALGYDPRGIDGIFGRGTRNAIRRWQLANRFENSGYLDADQYAKLRRDGNAALEQQRRQAEEARRIAEAEDNAYWNATGASGRPDALRAYLERYPEGLHAAEARAALAAIAEAEADAEARKERKAFRRAKRRNTAEAYRDYLARYPQGIYRDEALAALDEIEGAEREAAKQAAWERTERALNLSRQDRVSVEQRLRFVGFPVGRIDGQFDARTRSAIWGYQASRGLDETGYLNRPTVVTLVRETNQGQQGQVQIDGAEVIRGLLEALGRQ